MRTGNIRLSVDSSTALDRIYGRVLLSDISRSRRVRLFYLQNLGHPWCALGDYRLADIGKTRGDAEVEKLRHRLVIRDPREVFPNGSSDRIVATSPSVAAARRP